jgi:DNA-directed RNA polymerase specialized sigma24 family protein
MSENNGSDNDDRELCGRILGGVAASAELQERFRKPLEGFLVGMCDRGDGRSQEKAVEIASQILADCFTKSPSLLEKWEGGNNLGAFLNTAASNRLKSFWASAEKRLIVVNTESPRMAEAARAESRFDGDDKEIAVAEQSLRAGVTRAVEACPEGLVFLRLKGLHGVGQREISQCWGHHESQTSRRITEAMGMIRKAAVEEAESRGFELDIDVLREALQRNPAVLLGEAGGLIDFGDDASLRQLAAGRADVAARRGAVELMCRNPRALEFFAQLLNRKSDDEAVVVQDPELSGMGARLGEWIRRSLEILHPVEARGLVSPLMADTFADALRDVGADGGTLWLLRPGEAALEAVFNPLEPEIAGKRQPLVSGIVSLVLATGETSCVSAAVNHGHHSPAIDIAMGKTTRSMIAVPFVPAGNSRGVLTAVRLDSDHPFTQREIGVIERQSLVLAELFAANLSKRVTG